MNFEYKDVQGFETELLFEITENSEDYYLQRAWTMEEIAKRALSDVSLLDRLLITLGKHVAVEGRNGFPLGMLAAHVLTEGKEDRILQPLARSASEWSVWNQFDLFDRFFDDQERKESFDKMVGYGMRPKISVNEKGEVEPDPIYVK